MRKKKDKKFNGNSAGCRSITKSGKEKHENEFLVKLRVQENSGLWPSKSSQ